MSLQGQRTTTGAIPWEDFKSLIGKLERDGNYKYCLLISIGVFIGLLSGVAQSFRFREANWGAVSRKYFLHLGISIVIAATLTFAAAQWINVYAWQYQILLFSGLFAVVANLDYLFTFVRGNLKLAGSVISHIGFGLMIVGILASSLNKEHISTDPFTQRGLLNEEMLKRNVRDLQKQLQDAYIKIGKGETSESR